MKKHLLPMLLSFFTITAHAEIPVVKAQYCLGIYAGRDLIIAEVKEAIRIEKDPSHRESLEQWVLDHQNAKERLHAFLVANPAPSFLDMVHSGWRQNAMEQAKRDLEDDAKSRNACDGGAVCVRSMATERVAKCTTLEWLK